MLLGLVALALTAVALVQGGRLTTLDAEAQTGADAAALAAADEVARALRGPAVAEFLVTGRVPEGIVRGAREAAAEYAQANDTELVGQPRVVGDERRRVELEVTTRTVRRLGEPALTQEIREHRGEATAAARVELAVGRAGEHGGCLSEGAVREVAQRAGLAPPERSGLVECRDADVESLRPRVHEAVLRIEQVMGEIVVFETAYGRVEDHLPVGRGQTLEPAAVGHPGLAWHQSGLAFDAENAGPIAAALERAPAHSARLCQPYPAVDPSHYAHADSVECGGELGLDAGLLGLEITEIRLIDPDQMQS